MCNTLPFSTKFNQDDCILASEQLHLTAPQKIDIEFLIRCTSFVFPVLSQTFLDHHGSQ